MYGATRFALADVDYAADIQAAASAGTLRPLDYTAQNSSYATAAGEPSPPPTTWRPGSARWCRGKCSTPTTNSSGASPQTEDPAQPDGQKYGYGISYQRFGPHAAMYYHGGELPGFNSFIGYDPENDVSLVIWTDLTLAPDGRTTANAMLPAILDDIPGLSLAPATPTTR